MVQPSRLPRWWRRYAGGGYPQRRYLPDSVQIDRSYSMEASNRPRGASEYQWKSTLSIALTKSRDAIVADFAGLTRIDRHCGTANQKTRYIVIDTGALSPMPPAASTARWPKQTQQAVAEADVVILWWMPVRVSRRKTMTLPITCVALGKPCVLVANKAEGMLQGVQLAEFMSWAGQSISRVRGPRQGHTQFGDDGPGAANLRSPTIRMNVGQGRDQVAVAGRPNVGKSTSSTHGLVKSDWWHLTCRVRPAMPSRAFQRNGQRFELVDTAGLRRKGKVFEAIEILGGENAPGHRVCPRGAAAARRHQG